MTHSFFEIRVEPMEMAPGFRHRVAGEISWRTGRRPAPAKAQVDGPRSTNNEDSGVTTHQATRETTNSEQCRMPGVLRSSPSSLVPTPGAPNKPMVPTARASPATNPPRPLPRHTNQALLRRESA